ncbi:unnamed protein product [Urochloa decumbens]|uniref:BTB domain-containing protein n=1 Tax=Urochloa decumbens TaxID=240449 RepID=A0ABC9HCJ2_9POAL
MATSPASAAAAGGSVTTTATATMAGSHVLMIVDSYSKLKEVLRNGDGIKSDTFRAGGHSWFIEFHPSSDNIDTITELNASRLLGDSFQIRCVLSVVDEVTAVAPPHIHRHLGGLLVSQQLGGDVTFQVGGELFAAHKYILATRSPVFMAEILGPPGKENAAHVRIDGIEPRVFRALLHFVYTDTLPDQAVNEGDDGDKVAMAQGLLVAADRYDMERLKLICGNVLCNHIDARTAMPLLQLADSHGCWRLKEACIRAIKDLLAKVAAP